MNSFFLTVHNYETVFTFNNMLSEVFIDFKVECQMV